jgi:[acyl-carrier-protein] S-malonyltransferase
LTHVASVAGRRIERSRLEERVRRFREGPGGRHLAPDAHTGELLALRRWLLQDLVTEAVLAHEARAAGLAGDDGAEDGGAADTAAGDPAGTAAGDRADTAAATMTVDAATVRAMFEAVTADVRVAEGEMRAYYERNLDRYRTAEARRVTHWILGGKTAARRVRDEIETGVASGTVDVSYAGGSPMELHRGEFAGPLEDAIFAAEAGDVVGPIRTEHGWHVARVEAISGEVTAAYHAVHAEIEAELLAAARGRFFAEWLEGKRRELATVEPGWEHPADPVHGVIPHRH